MSGAAKETRSVRRLANGLEATLKLKNVKNLRICVKPTGEVEITAPRRAGVRLAMAFANEKLAWIERKRAEALAKLAARPGLESGGSVPLWGEALPLRVEAGKLGAELSDGAVTLYAPEGATFEQRRAALLMLYRAELEREIPPLVAKYAAALELSPPAWSLRDMRTRHGSCTPSRGAVRFALSLAAGPRLCLEYVVAHELVHLRIPGHGPDFHALLQSVFPEENKARRRLRTCG